MFGSGSSLCANMAPLVVNTSAFKDMEVIGSYDLIPR